MTDGEFRTQFEALTGKPPLRWQERLFHSHFAKADLPDVIDIPTGMGKTMIMAIWLIARARLGGKIPTRLIYVVDRRTVVDQATDIVEEFACLLSTDKSELFKRIAERKPELGERKTKHGETLRHLRELLCLGDDTIAISTLRGQLADNREWTRDPAKPAIIIGTVDLIGSGLLFSGYRSSFKAKPLQAGLLAQDSLLVLDEAHLSKPFEKLICELSDKGRFQKGRDGETQGVPMRVIRMSATSPAGAGNRFQLEQDDLADPVIKERFEASKRLKIVDLGAKDDLNKRLAEAAIGLAQNPEVSGKRIVVFVKIPADAKAIAETIRDHAKPNKNKSNPDPKGTFADCVEVLSGTMRGMERDELVRKSVFLERWLNGELEPSDPLNQDPVFLVSTSAGEVGFDLNADHLVGDAAPLDSWIQRLGRVNRRGKGSARVILIREADPDQKTDFAKATFAASQLFSDGMDVSPQALAEFKASLSTDQIEAASSPRPTMVELTDILLDAWSMTSIAERMPGRPEVAPWLRGIDDELPQTTVAWRAELDLFKDDPDPRKALKTVFAEHRIRPHETLTTYSSHVLRFLNEATGKKGRPELRNTRVVVKLSRETLLTTINDLISRPGILNADPTLILPASFGGLDDRGMLSPETVGLASRPEEILPLDVADAPGYEEEVETERRQRVLIEQTENRWKAKPLPHARFPAEVLGSLSSYDSKWELRKDITAKQPGIRIRHIQPVEHNADGEETCSLIMLAALKENSKKREELLELHVGVEIEARRIADNLKLDEASPVRIALRFAAKWHDEGKRSEVWQRFICGDVLRPLGKSAKYCDPKKLAGYRHEFGSLLRIISPEPNGAAETAVLPDDAVVKDLAMHLIAVHHGNGRPHFANPIDRDFHDQALIEGVHTEVIRRFARLQRKYGWWQLAWLENLLRCADAMASATVNPEELQEDDAEGGQL